MQKNRRVSNIELLRILSIFLITMHHLVVHGSNACGYLTNYSFEQGTLGIILNSFCIIGVNVFILISGWFGIKNPIKATIHLMVDFVILSTLMNIGLYLHQGNLGELNIIETYKLYEFDTQGNKKTGREKKREEKIVWLCHTILTF